MNFSFLGKYVLVADIRCKTGLHIGGSTTGLEIGGVDNPVIKDPITGQPYIPGSGLRGKLRSLTEWNLGLIAKHSKHDSYSAYECAELQHDRPQPPDDPTRWDKALTLGKLFGASSDDNKVRMRCGPSRLIVRDSFLVNTSVQKLEEALGQGLFTEVKTENALDRVTAEATPRPLERVPAGSVFSATFLVDIYGHEEHNLLEPLFSAMQLLEHSALGGAGSRGSGQIEFMKLSLICRPLAYYQKDQAEVSVFQAKTLREMVTGFSSIDWPI